MNTINPDRASHLPSDWIAIDEVGGGLHHAAGAAGGAEVADLAGEGHQVVVAAGTAVHAGEAVGRDAAGEEILEARAQLVNEAGIALAAGTPGRRSLSLVPARAAAAADLLIRPLLRGRVPPAARVNQARAAWAAALPAARTQQAAERDSCPGDGEVSRDRGDLRRYRGIRHAREP